MKQQNIKMRDDASVDLLDLIKRVLIEWRVILLLAVLVGALFFVYFHKRDQRKAQQQVNAQEQNQQLSQTTDESLRASLTKDELNAVLLAVQQSKMINERTEYLSKSRWMQEGCDGVTQVQFMMTIQGPEVKSSYLRRYYGNYVYSSDFVKMLSELFGEDIDEASVADYIGVDLGNMTQTESVGEPGTMIVAVTIPDGVDANLVTQSVTEAIQDYCGELSAYAGDHTVKFESKDIRSRYDQSPVNRRRDLLYELYNIKAQMKATMESFSTRQRLLYEKLSGEMTDEELTTASSSTTKGYGKGMFLAGAILAVFVYICMAFLVALIMSRIHSAKELTGIPCLGEIRHYRAKNGLDLLIRSKLIYGLLYKKQDKEEKALQMAVLGAQGMGTERVTLIQMFKGTEESVALSRRLIDVLSEKKIQTDVVEVVPDQGILPGSFEGHDNVIVLLKSGDVKYSVMKEMVSICSLSRIQILGYILYGN